MAQVTSVGPFVHDSDQRRTLLLKRQRGQMHLDAIHQKIGKLLTVDKLEAELDRSRNSP